MKRTLIMLILVAMLVVPAAAQEEQPVRIGLLMDQSGWLSLYGFETDYGFRLGLLYAAGIDPMDYESIDDALADVTVNGVPIELILADYGSENSAADAENAAAQARRLIESEFVDIIVGTPNSGAAVQVQELTSPDNFDILFMVAPGASPSLTGPNFNINTFRACRNTDHDAAALSTVAPDFGDSYIQIAIDTDFGRATAEAFQQSLAEVGVEQAGDVILVPTDVTDFTPFIQQILDSGADFVNPILAGGPIVLWSQQSEELGLTEEMLVLTGTNSNDAIVAAPPAVDSVAYIVYQYTLPETEINDWMTERYIEFYNDVPDLFSECGFATAQAVYAALETTQGDPLPEAMIPALEGLMFDGPKGEYYIRPGDHQAIMPQYVIQFKGVEDVELSDELTAPQPIYDLFAEVSAEESAPPCRLQGEFAERCEMNEMTGE